MTKKRNLVSNPKDLSPDCIQKSLPTFCKPYILFHSISPKYNSVSRFAVGLSDA